MDANHRIIRVILRQVKTLMDLLANAEYNSYAEEYDVLMHDLRQVCVSSITVNSESTYEDADATAE